MSASDRILGYPVVINPELTTPALSLTTLEAWSREIVARSRNTVASIRARETERADFVQALSQIGDVRAAPAADPKRAEIAMLGIPIVVDDTVPAGEVHLCNSAGKVLHVYHI